MTYAAGRSKVAILASMDPWAVAAETDSNHQVGTLFTLIVIETARPAGSNGQQLMQDMGRQLKQKSDKPASTFYLVQRISVAVEQGNAILILDNLAHEARRSAFP